MNWIAAMLTTLSLLCFTAGVLSVVMVLSGEFVAAAIYVWVVVWSLAFLIREERR